MFKIIIDGNCSLENLIHFDSVATMSGLYDFSSVIVDSRYSSSLEIPLNTKITLLLPFQIEENKVSSIIDSLSKAIDCGRISSVFFTGDSFIPPALYAEVFQATESVMKDKEISLENLSYTDLDILKEYYMKLTRQKETIRISNPFFATIRLTERGDILLDDENYCNINDFTIEKGIELFKNFFGNEEFIKNYVELTNNAYNNIDKEVNSALYREDMFLLNNSLSVEEIISYKKKVIDFINTLDDDISLNFCNDVQFHFTRKLIEYRKDKNK